MEKYGKKYLKKKWQMKCQKMLYYQIKTFVNLVINTLGIFVYFLRNGVFINTFIYYFQGESILIRNRDGSDNWFKFSHFPIFHKFFMDLNIFKIAVTTVWPYKFKIYYTISKNLIVVYGGFAQSPNIISGRRFTVAGFCCCFYILCNFHIF